MVNISGSSTYLVCYTPRSHRHYFEELLLMHGSSTRLAVSMMMTRNQNVTKPRRWPIRNENGKIIRKLKPSRRLIIPFLWTSILHINADRSAGLSSINFQCKYPSRLINRREIYISRRSFDVLITTSQLRRIEKSDTQYLSYLSPHRRIAWFTVSCDTFFISTRKLHSHPLTHTAEGN